jgi:hypothetical protein
MFAQLFQFKGQPYLIFTQDVDKKDEDKIIISYFHLKDEIWLSLELEKLGKHFALVRTMIDVDINNAKNNGKDKKMIIPEIKERIETTLNKFPELMKTKGTISHLHSGR